MRDWDEAQDLFYRGVDATAEERSRILAGRDSDLAEFVRRLWLDHPFARSFLPGAAAGTAPARSVFPKGHRVGGRFTVLEFVGQGGMGEVYRAEDELLGRTVALKSIRADLEAGAAARRRLESEARSICALSHPGICTLYDLCWDGEQPFLVMEFLSGTTLAGRLAEGRIATRELVSIGIQLADALAFAHGRGVVHLDLKPANIMLTEVGVKVLDFGIARQALAAGSRSVSAVEDREIAGSAAYMSPEQAEGKEVDLRTDLFSLGAVLYEMATGARAFQGDSVLSTMSAVVNLHPPDLRRLDPAKPKALERIVRKCLCKNPDARYHDADEIGRDLRAVVRPSHRLAWVAIGAALLVAAVTAGGWFRFKPPEHAAVAGRGRQLTRDPGVTNAPALSPDGKMVAYMSDRDSADGQTWLWIQPANGGAARRLEASCDRSGTLTFSRDGKTVVYACSTADGDTVLNEVSLDSGRSRLIAPHLGAPVFSHDGSRLAVVSNFNRLKTISWPDGSLADLCPGTLVIGRPIWSPSDDTLLFPAATEQDQQMRLWSLRLTDKRLIETPLFRGLRQRGFEVDAAPLRSVTLISWTRNAVYLAVTVKGDSDVLRVPVDADLNVNGQPTFVTANAHPGDASAAGGRIAYEVPTAVRGIWSVEGGLVGSGAAPTRHAAFETAMGVNSKVGAARTAGKAATYVESGSDSGTLYLSDLQTGVKQPLAEPKWLIWPGPVLTPDASRIAWASQQDQSNPDSTVWVSDIAGGRAAAPEAVLRGRQRRPYDWTPDGSGLFFGDQMAHSIYRLNYPAKTIDTIIHAEDAYVQCAKVSPDGSRLLFSANPIDGRAGSETPSVYVARLSGSAPVPRKEWRLVLDTVTAFNCSYDWSPDGNTIYLGLATEITSVPNARGVSAESGGARVLFQSPAQAQLMSGLFAIGSRIMFVMDEYHSNVWVQDLALE